MTGGNDRFELIPSKSPAWIFDQNTLVILEVNEAAISEYGYTREEFLRMTIVDVRPSEDIPKLLRGALHPSHRHEAECEVWRHQRKNGSMMNVVVSSKDLVFDGHRAELVWMDILGTPQQESSIFSK